MVGRPPKYDTPEQMKEAIDAYFDNTPVATQTITGLVLALGFSDRQSLYDYQEKDEFTCIIKAARTRVEHSYEISLRGQNVTGAIFALKNMGWKDKAEVDQNITGNMGFVWNETKTYVTE
jgi:hypothetical protein